MKKVKKNTSSSSERSALNKKNQADNKKVPEIQVTKNFDSAKRTLHNNKKQSKLNQVVCSRIQRIYLTLPAHAVHYLQFKNDITDYTVAAYNCQEIPDSVLTAKNFTDKFVLWGSAYQSLFLGIQFIEGPVVNAFMLIKCLREWKNVSYFPTEQNNYIFGHSMNTDKNNDWEFYNLNNVFRGKIFFPYCIGVHWMLFVVDVDQGTMMHIDPQNRIEKDCAVNAFYRYLQDCRKRRKNNMCNISWTVIEPPPDRLIQGDGYNCGFYVMFMMDQIAKDNSLSSKSFNPDIYRYQISEMLFANSININNICLYCENPTNEEKKKIYECSVCNRWAHEKCALNVAENCLASIDVKISDPLIEEKICHLCKSEKNQ